MRIYLAARRRQTSVFLLLAAGLFAIDCLAPPGVLDGIGYPFLLPPVARRGGRRSDVVAGAAFCTVLTILGEVITPQGGIGHLEVLNRIVALAGSWIMQISLVSRLKLEESLEGLKSRAEAASRAKSDFLARMGRELRSASGGAKEILQASGADESGSPATGSGPPILRSEDVVRVLQSFGFVIDSTSSSNFFMRHPADPTRDVMVSRERLRPETITAILTHAGVPVEQAAEIL